MKSERMRIKIAEHLGAKWYWTSGVRYLVLGFVDEPPIYPLKPEDSITGYKPLLFRIPDYPNDLNSCHNMEKFFDSNPEKKKVYVYTLVSLMNPGEYTVCASSEKRCEAFCKTVGIWED